jgi:hypothetical protein
MALTTKQFNALVSDHMLEVASLLDMKGGDYTTNDDRLSHFKEAAEAMGITREQAWGIFAGKHWNAIQTFCKNGAVQSEPIEGRVYDMIAYCLLFLGLLGDQPPQETDDNAQPSASDYTTDPK